MSCENSYSGEHSGVTYDKESWLCLHCGRLLLKGVNHKSIEVDKNEQSYYN